MFLSPAGRRRLDARSRHPIAAYEYAHATPKSSCESTDQTLIAGFTSGFGVVSRQWLRKRAAMSSGALDARLRRVFTSVALGAPARQDRR